jgi:hypothetical protein
LFLFLHCWCQEGRVSDNLREQWDPTEGRSHQTTGNTQEEEMVWGGVVGAA